MTDYQPSLDGLGVAFCSDDKCQQYDGKRCRLMGFQPHGICEPWARDLVELVDYVYIHLQEAQFPTGEETTQECIESAIDKIREVMEK